MAYTALTGAFSGIYTALEAGYFRDEGIDLQLDFIANTSTAIAGLLSGQDELSTLDGMNTVQADLTGADLRLFIALTNRLAFSLMTQPGINSAADLKGKTIGITAPGSSADTAARQALQVLGLTTDDVTLLPLGQNPAIVAGLQSHQIDAGILSPPSNSQAAAFGAKELINMATDGPPFASVTIGGRQSFLNDNQALIQAFTRAYSRGVARFKEDPAFGQQAIAKNLQLTDPAIIQDTWRQFNLDLASVPLIDPEGMQNAINGAAAAEPSAASTSPDQYLDSSFVQDLQNQGYYKQLGLE